MVECSFCVDRTIRNCHCWLTVDGCCCCSLFYRCHVPALTVNASMNCSFHDDVPIRSEAFALCTNLSTVLCNLHKMKGKQTNIYQWLSSTPLPYTLFAFFYLFAWWLIALRRNKTFLLKWPAWMHHAYEHLQQTDWTNKMHFEIYLEFLALFNA